MLVYLASREATFPLTIKKVNASRVRKKTAPNTSSWLEKTFNLKESTNKNIPIRAMGTSKRKANQKTKEDKASAGMCFIERREANGIKNAWKGRQGSGGKELNKGKPLSLHGHGNSQH